MSNIGKQIIQIKEGVQVTVENKTAVVTGPKGTLEQRIPAGISLDIAENVITVKKNHESRELKKFYGMTRALLANMVTGVSDGFTKQLELSGVGYRAKLEGADLVLNVGYAHPVKISPPAGITFTVADNLISVSGINKELIGDIASKIRKVRPPDPYKAKGVKYVGEIIRKKAGKSAKAGAK
jgi:large subunit ribosomal protein L6